MSRAMLEPCAVVMTLRNGTVIEEAFATRNQAELFLYLLPIQMATRPDGLQVASAILSPLVPARPLGAVPVSAARFDHIHQ